MEQLNLKKFGSLLQKMFYQPLKEEVNFDHTSSNQNSVTQMHLYFRDFTRSQPVQYSDWK